MDLVAKIRKLHKTLSVGGLSHAFGGALALAWCTERARGTIDIDVNVFVTSDSTRAVLDALPSGVKVTKVDESMLARDGQVRVWWDKTPVDIFLNSTDLHQPMSERIRWEVLGGESLPFLSCSDLALFKAFFNRTKDWADLEAMHEVGTLDIASLRSTLVQYLGDDDERLQRLDELRRHLKKSS
jgi:hypothetical protein